VEACAFGTTRLRIIPAASVELRRPQLDDVDWSIQEGHWAFSLARGAVVGGELWLRPLPAQLRASHALPAQSGVTCQYRQLNGTSLVSARAPVRGRHRAAAARGCIMALRAWARLARLDKLRVIPRGACFSLPAGRQPGHQRR